MKLNLSDRIYTTILGLWVSHASYMYAVNDSRNYAVYFFMCLTVSIYFTIILYRERIAQAIFKSKREIDKHPDLRDDLDLL